MLQLPNQIILIDTEYTTWEGAQERNWSGPNEYREIVQIAAVKVDTKQYTETDAFDCYIRPVRNPKLSQFFTNLTHITQEMIDEAGVDLKTALDRLASWSDESPFYCYGHDGAVIRENCTLLGITFPFRLMRFYDIRPIFQMYGIDDRNFSSGTIMTAFGRPLPADPHNALNDVRGILEGLRIVSDTKKCHDTILDDRQL